MKSWEGGSGRSFTREPCRLPGVGVTLVLLALMLAGGEPGVAASVVRRVEGTSRVEHPPRVTESWAETVGRSVQPARSIPWHIGHFPGFRTLKARANSRRSNALSTRNLLERQQSSSSGTGQGNVFNGPNQADTNETPPDSIIAAGPNYILVAVNSLLAIYDKSGNLQGSYQTLSDFFGSLNLTGEIFDPRVIYDQADQRFILTAAEIDFSGLTNGYILLAVSETSDPRGTWNKWALNFMGRSTNGAATTFPDFPTVGLSSSAVYIATNQFELTQSCLQTDTENCQFSDAWLTVVGLPGLLDPAQNPSLAVTTFRHVLTADGQLAFSIQPAVTCGGATDEFLVAADFNANPSRTLNLYDIPVSGTPTLSSTNLTVPPFSLPPDAVQEGSSNLIDTDDFRPLNAVSKNGSLWFAQNVSGSTGSDVVAAWYELQVNSLATASVTQSGAVSGTGDAYYPAIGVENDGGVGLAFTTSSDAAYPSAAYTEREASDPPGTTRSFAVYQAGGGPYDHETGVSRWGDYSGVSLDPSGNALWTIAEYASTPDPQFATSISEQTGPPSLSVSPSSLNFGTISLGSTSASQTVTLSNIGSGTVSLGHAALTGSNATEFKISADSCSGVALGPGQSCTIAVTFNPSSSFSYTAVLSIPVGNSSVSIGLLGEGASETGTASLSLSATSLTFPATPVGSMSAPQTITVTSAGTGSALVSGISVYGAFTETNNCSNPLPPGSSCHFSIVFRPAATGNQYGLLSFSSQIETAYPDNVSLVGVGTPTAGIVLCPQSLNFPPQVVNSTSSAQAVIVTNNGSANLTITGVTATRSFSETNNCPGSLPPFGSCVVNVTFTPAAAGSLTGSVTINDDASGSPQTISLAGTGSSVSGELQSISPVGSLAFVQGQLDRSRSVGAAVLHQRHSRDAALGSPSTRNLALVSVPLDFEQNEGQFSSRIRFISHIGRMSLAVLQNGLVIALPFRVHATNDPATASGGIQQPGGSRRHRPFSTFGGRLGSPRAAVVEMHLVGASSAPIMAGKDKLSGTANYFIGRDPKRWHTRVPIYGKVQLSHVYPGVALAYYGNQRRLEYDFTVSPGADFRQIRLAFMGVSSLQIAKNGDLVLGTPAGPVRFDKPVVYQPPRNSRWAWRRNGGLRHRKGTFVLAGAREVSFKIGRYDHHAPLVIDPVLSYSTYLGGSASDAANGIAVDSSGDAYITGVTYSTDFPITTGAFQSNCGGGGHPCQPTYHSNVFVSKLSSDGSKLIYSTYLGGEMDDEGNAVAVDSSGDAYVTGTTQSPDFPVTAGAFQTICSQPSQGQCASTFVTKLNPSGSGLVYSTYLGGAPGSQRSDQGNAIAVDSAGDAYVGGGAGSTNFPTTTGAFQTTVVPATGTLATHGFMTELNPSGSALLYSTLLGGSGGETVNGIALDGSGNIYVAGATTSLDFPTTANAIEPGPSNNSISSPFSFGFVVKFTASGKVIYSSYFNAPIQGIATDSAGAAYLAGGATGAVPATTGAFENASDVTAPGASFVTKLHPAGCALTYSTYLNGIDVEGSVSTAIAVDAEGDSYIIGSGKLPEALTSLSGTNSLQPLVLGGSSITELNPSGSALLFTTAFGGSDADSVKGVAVDAHGDIYVAGETTSNDFPIVNAIQPDCIACHFNVKTSAFVAKIVPGVPAPVSLTRPELTFFAASTGNSFYSQLEALGLMNNQATPLTISSVSVSGTAFSLGSPTAATCSGTIAANSGCLIYVEFQPQSAGGYTGTLTINDSGPGSPRTVALRGAAGEPFSVTASPQFTGNPLAGTDSLSYIVSVPSLAGYSGVPGQVALTCLNSAAPATCSFSPASVAVGGQSTLTLTGLSNLNLEDSDSFGFTISATYGGQTLPVPLTIKFADFRPSSSSTSATISAGQTATYSISYLPVNGFTGQVDLTCTGAPAETTCALSPYNLSLSGTAASTVTVTVATAAPSALLPPAPPEDSSKQRLLLELAALLLLIFALLCRQMQKYPFALWRRLVALGAVALLAVGMAGCGGGGGGSGGGGGNPGTPAGTYTLTVTGLVNEASTTLKQNISLTLTVK